MIEFRVLGPLKLRGADGESLSALLAQPKRTALLAFLAADSQNAFHPRDQLLGLFWPELDQDHARNALRKALQFLRQHLGEEVIVCRGEEVGVAEEALWCDAAAFEQALERGELEEAVGFYGGALLDGFHVKDAAEFERWLDGKRQRLATRYAEALESLATGAEGEGRFVRAAGWWQQLAVQDPYNSRVVLRLMQALAAAGDPANAIQHAESHQAFLERELGLEPPEELLAYAQQLRRQPDRRGVPAVEASPTVGAADEPAAGPARDTERPGELARERRRRIAWQTAGLATVATALIAVVAVLWLSGGRSETSTRLASADAASDRERIVLAEFEDQTAAGELGELVTAAFRIDLSRSTRVQVAEPSFIRQALLRMQRDPGQPLDLALAREVAIREGLSAVISGEVSEVGGSYSISVAIVSAESGAVLAGFRETAADSTAVLGIVDRLSRAVREQVGESITSIERSEPLEMVTTSSLEALRKYSRAILAWTDADDAARAIELFEEAIALDTTFAAAYLELSKILEAKGERARSVEALMKAYQYRGRLTDRERYEVMARHHYAAGHIDQAIAAYENLLELYPTNLPALNNLAIIYYRDRDFARAEQLYLRAVLADSTVPQPYRNAMMAQVAQGKFEDAEATHDRYLKNVPTPDSITYAAYLASARGDYATARSLYLQRDLRTLALRVFQAFSLAKLDQVEGRLADAESHWREVAAGLEAMPGLEAQQSLWAAARIATLDLWQRGRPSAALRTVTTVLERYPLDSLPPLDRPYLPYVPDKPVEDGLVPFLALAGQPDRARHLLSEYESVVEPRFRKRHESSIHAARGLIALAEGRAHEAIAELRAWDSGTLCTVCALPHLARAYEAAGAVDSAVAVYERYLTTPWLFRLSTDCNHLPLTYERLGELYKQRGDFEKAVHYYGKFVDLWKEADPELQPRVEAARRAMETLSQQPLTRSPPPGT